MNAEEEIAALKRALEREKQARKEAERIMEEKSMELHLTNQQLIKINETLENTIVERTREINLLARIPEENPYPIFRFRGTQKEVLYSNKAGESILQYFKENPEAEETLRFYEFLENSQQKIHPELQEFTIYDKTYQFYSVCYAELEYMNVYGFDTTLLKETQTALKESEFRFRSMVENANDIIYRSSVEGLFTYVNITAEFITEYSTEELLKMHYTELVRKDQREIIADFYAAQIREKINSTYLEFPLITKSGKEKWIGQSVQLIINDAGRITEVFAMARDITERKQVQSVLTRTATRLKSLVANIQAGVLMEDEQQNIVIVNQTFCNLFDLKDRPNQFQGKSNSEIFNQIKSKFSEVNDLWDSLLKALRQNKAIINKELQLTNGKVLETDVVPIFQEQKFLGNLMIFRDVTERNEQQKILQRSEEKYRSIIENMYLGLLQVDNDEIILDVNNSMCEMLGYTKEELIGKRTLDVIFVEEEKEIFNQVNQKRKTGLSSVYEIRIRRKDGSIFYVLISGAPLYNERNEKIGSIGIHLDITDRKMLEQDLVVARNKAEESVRAKELFLANMSHEIRTPMNAILGITNLFLNTELDSTQLSYLDAIRTSSNNLMVIINDILDFSKIEAGKLELEKVGVYFHALANNVVSQMSFRADEKNILLTRIIDPDIPPIIISDQTRMTQIFLNLLSNAIKFTHEGTVTFICSLEEKDDRYCTIKFRVKDTGIGIDESKLATIFDSFSQEDLSTTRKYGGSGLGLSITRQLVELCGGKIHVKSKKGKGTEFYFSIRFEIGTEKDLPKEEYIVNPIESIAGLHILLAEDHHINQFLAKTILESWGIEVTIAENGKEAVDAVREKPFDLVLMDMQMPEMDGLQATREIRNSLNSNIPIVALTANAIRGDQEKCLQAGMDDYLSKPFEQKDLFRIIQKWVRKINIPTPESIIQQMEFHSPVKSVINENKLFDLSHLRQLALGDEDFIQEMIEIFISSSEEILNEMKAAYENKEYEKLGSLAHKIKPSIDTFLVEPLRETVRHIEQAHKTGSSSSEIDEWMMHFSLVLELVLSELKVQKEN